MKKFIPLTLALLITITSIAQQSINYKAIIKDGLGNALTNQNITVQFNILETSTTGTIIYTETHTPTTDANGLIILNIGDGTTNDVFTDITWGNDDHFLNVQIDTAGGTTYTDMGTTQFMAVPYAKHAEIANNVTGLEKITESGNGQGDPAYGWRLIGQDPNNYGDIGFYAVDLSSSSSASTTKGATGFASTAIGFNTSALGNFSTAMGHNTATGGESSSAMGEGTTAVKDYTTAMGLNTTAFEIASTAMGANTTASGIASTAMGLDTEAKSFGQTTIGIYSTNTETPNSIDSYNATDRLFVIGNGEDEDNRSDALVIFKNGNTQLNGLLTLDDNNGNGFTFPNVDGTANQVLETDGSGALTWVDAPFTEINNVTIGRYSNDFVFGSFQLDDIDQVFFDNSRFFFDKSKSAFRAGYVDRFEWDEINIGEYSIAMGYSTMASNLASTAFGHRTVSSGWASTAMGINTMASNLASTAMGSETTATGRSSTAMGENTIAHSFAETAIGLFNTAVKTSSDTAYNANDRLFIIGNGQDSDNRSDALIMLKNGTITAPSFDVSEITDDKALITKEYADANYGNEGTEIINEGFGNGLAKVGRVPENYGIIGLNAVDLSYGDTSSTTRGATGNNATALGTNTTASGAYSTASGIYSRATGNVSIAMGDNTTASGTTSTAMGQNTIATAYVTAVGRFNVGGGNNTNWIATDPLFEVGNGTNSGNRSNALTILKNGKIGIGSSGTSPDTQLHIRNGSDASLSSGSGFLAIGNITQANLVFDSNEIMARNNGNTSTLYLQRDGGDLSVGGSVVHSSDRRLKKDIEDLPYGLNEILQLQPKSYNWKNRNQEYKSLGLIAQDVQPVIKEIVTTQDDEQKTLGISYTELIPILIKAIQEQQEIIDSQQTEIKSLTSELAETNENQTLFNTKIKQLEALEARLSALENNASKKSDDNTLLTAQNNN